MIFQKFSCKFYTFLFMTCISQNMSSIMKPCCQLYYLFIFIGKIQAFDNFLYSAHNHQGMLIIMKLSVFWKMLLK